MKNPIYFLLLLLIINSAIAQENKRDSLLSELSSSLEDTTKVKLYNNLTWLYYNQNNFDSALLMAYRGLELAQSLEPKRMEIECMWTLGTISWNLGDYATGIKYAYPIIEYAQAVKDTNLWIRGHAILNNSYRDQGDFEEALQISKNIIPIVSAWQNCRDCGVANAVIGTCFFGLEQYDSALYYIEKGLTYPKDFAYGWALMMLGRTMTKLNDDEMAFRYLRQSIQPLIHRPNLKDLTSTYAYLSELFTKNTQYDSAIYYGIKAVNTGKPNGFNKELLASYLALSHAYENVDKEKALDNYKLAVQLKDDIYSQDKQRQITSLKFNEILKQNEIHAAEEASKNRLKLNTLLGSTFTLLVIAFFLFRSRKAKQKSMTEIENAYTKLKSTQSQLIQSEKMASLGELTAGIAHEIQNPLNFVNNFSEVNSELIEDMNLELVRGNYQEAMEISNDIKTNGEKIKHHGKRADAIVKSMLQHSQKSSGQKELTDINALCDEYLRLAYHGMCAKDKNFKAEIKLDLDPTLPKIKVVPQDIGRVLLNLINNGFHAVAKVDNPEVTIATGREDSPLGAGGSVGAIIITISDNGPGIPDEIKDKIFQPFFTTKPTGQGTGLGLSLAYDIVKAHGGELKVESKPGAGSLFIIQLPLVLNTD